MQPNTSRKSNRSCRLGKLEIESFCHTFFVTRSLLAVISSVRTANLFRFSVSENARQGETYFFGRRGRGEISQSPHLAHAAHDEIPLEPDTSRREISLNPGKNRSALRSPRQACSPSDFSLVETVSWADDSNFKTQTDDWESDLINETDNSNFNDQQLRFDPQEDPLPFDVRGVAQTSPKKNWVNCTVRFV